MGLTELLVASGALSWAYFAWLGYQRLRSLLRRLRWAIVGHAYGRRGASYRR